MYLISHRLGSGAYVAVNNLPLGQFPIGGGYANQFMNEVRNRWQGNPSQKSPQLALKEALIAVALYASGDGVSVERDTNASMIWSEFQSILRQLLPRTLKFDRLMVRQSDILCICDTGNFVLDEMSGGISAIIEMAWQIYIEARGKSQFTALIDEPENHLHPSLQRELLPKLLEAFPTIQFIVATHSPFVVTSSADSAVYALDYDEERVASRELDYVNKAASADETLRRVLGLDSTTPIWADQVYRGIVERFILSGDLSPERVEALRSELAAIGMESAFPGAMVDVVDADRAGRDD